MKPQTHVRVLAKHKLGNTIAIYQEDIETGRVGLCLIPVSKQSQLAQRRILLKGTAVDGNAKALGLIFRAYKVDSLVQVHESSDPYASGFAQGRTMRGGATVERLLLEKQTVLREKATITIRTTFKHRDHGWLAHHDLVYRTKKPWLESTVTVENASSRPLSLEMLASFSIGGVSPFAADASVGTLKMHRLRSVWSMEGRLETRALEDLQLEASWCGWAVRSERFGTVGSMPVNGFFPFVAVEDTHAGVVWAAQVAHPGSWQMEVYRRDDTVSISGGLADRELGHWVKQIAPGGSFTSPRACLVCVDGDIEAACSALTAAQEGAALAASPRAEKGLPVIFNEWGTTWGKPTHDKMTALAHRLRSTGVKYLVMDAGWFRAGQGGWNQHGDWVANSKAFPHGLRAMADTIRAEGLIPGIWFEFETAGAGSNLYAREDWMLQRDGRVLTVGERRFLDFRKKEVIDYLSERVIGTLREGNFGYLKIDYNETIGLGVDGAESLGEGLREHLAAVQEFFKLIRRELPDLVIENCSSGGHRLEPSMLGLTAMSSFSDAHECSEIPIIAANLHRVMLPRQSQIWAVLREGEPLQRTYYSLAAGFLGRLCFSGDLLGLREEQMELVSHAARLYSMAVPVIEQGRSFRFGPEVLAYRQAQGWQAVLRVSLDGTRALAVMHSFAEPTAEKIEIPLPPGAWLLQDTLGFHAPEISQGVLRWPTGGAWNGCVAVLKKKV
jgi:alpha-galactosidase